MSMSFQCCEGEMCQLELEASLVRLKKVYINHTDIGIGINI